MVFFGNRARRRAEREAATAMPASVPAGQIVYAIGDVHGRADLLTELFEQIETDRRARSEPEATVIMLGDLIDRGPQSAQAIDLCLDRPPTNCAMRYLLGNHEEMMLTALDGSLEGLRFWMRNGGIEAMESYGVPDRIFGERGDTILGDFAPRVPPRHLRLLRRMEDCIVIGDYGFVHAGVRPGVELAQQKASDLRWIRDRFLDHEGDFGAVIVHGHTITDGVDHRANRIGIDTGAYESDVLTAVGLCGTDRWFLHT